MQWYYAQSGRPMGPIEDGEFENLVRSGRINAETLVWHEGMSEWTKFGAVSGKLETVQPASAAGPARGICRECGRSSPVQDMIEYEGALICAECKPRFFQRLREGAALPGMMSYAGFWIRAAAKVLDQVILSLVTSAASFVLSPLLAGAVIGSSSGESGNSGLMIGMVVFTYSLLLAFCLGVPAFYNIWFVGKYGATPGKMACGLRIVRSAGEKVTYGRACGRFFAEMVTGLTFGIGYIIVAFDDEKRALHDHICDTRVIKKTQ
ncbi:MAG: RDD family protein [Kiritimatiellia bacterium]